MRQENTANKIVNIYVLFLTAVFPLFLTNSYYNVSTDKLYSFLYSTIICMVLVLLSSVAAFFGSGKNKKNKKSFDVKTAKRRPYPADIFSKIKLSRADIFVLCFFAVLIISTLFSNWRFEAFWGNKGRYNGCFMWIFYIVSYFMISRLCIIKKWHILFFLLTGFIISAWGILDYFYMSPIGWQKAYGSDYSALNFSSTLGNVNLVTTYEGMLLLLSSAIFIGNDSDEPDKKENGSRYIHMALNIFPAVVSVVAFAGLICGLSDNAIISAAAAVCFLPFYAFRNKKSILKYLDLLVGWLAVMLLIGIITLSGVKTVSRGHWGELLILCVDHTGFIIVLFAAAVILFAVSALIFHFYGSRIDDILLARVLRIIWTVLGIAAAAVLVFLFYDANTGGTWEIYKKYSKVFIFDDSWGTHRGFNWGLAFSYIREFPLFKRLFGSGPETYYIYTFSYDRNTMHNAFHEMYDSPHNEFIQYLFTTGILGVISYYGWVINTLVSGFRNKMHGYAPIMTALAYAVLAYTLVSFVNISTPVLEPILIMCMALIQTGEAYTDKVI